MTDTSGVFSLPSADERRAFRDRLGRGIAYFIPPELRQLGTFLADATPSAALERAGSASMRMVAPGRTPSERVGDFGNMLSETATVVSPVAATRFGVPSAEAAQEVFMGISAPVRSATETFFERMNQPGPMPERLMSGIDPLAAFRAAREAVLGASNETPFEDLVELSSRQSAARDAAVEALSGARNVRLFDPQGRGVVVGEGMGPGEEGKFRVTYFNAERRPSNHTVYDTREEALNAALQEGFTLPTADRGPSEFDPEAIIRALREGVPAAEARLADDMRIGNERIRAESLARTGEIPSVTPPERYAEFLNQRGFSPDFQELVLGPMGDRFDTVRHIFDEDTDFALDSLRNVAGDTAGPEQLASTRSQVTRLTQELLRDFPEEITVYRAGRVVPGQPQSFTLDPNYDVSGNLPWREGSDNPLQAYTVNKADILASPDITRRGAIGEGEVIIRGDNVSRIAARGPENFAEGGAVMMRSNMSKELQGGIGGFANRAKNMFNEGGEVEREEREGPSIYERIKGDQYWISPTPGVRDAATTEEDKIDLLKQMGLVMTAQAGGEAVSLNRAQPSVTELTNSLYETGRPELFTQYEDEYFVNSPLGYAAFFEGEPFPGEAAKWAQPEGPMEELLRGVRRETGAADRVQGSGNQQNVMDLVQLYDFLQRKPASDLTASEQRLLEEIPVYLSRTTGMADGGEVRPEEFLANSAIGRGPGQGSTTGRPVSGSAAGVNLGADDDFLTSVRNRVMRQSGVDPLRIAMDEGVDPDLFLRLIAQESGGRADAQSDAGAYGFTQLMDATARELGVDRTDPVQNLRGGARYLRQQLDRFQDVPLALAAYNAGPTAVERFGGIPPYSETRAYVARILGLPGGEMGISPPMRPDPILPTPRPPMQGPMLEGDPLGQLGNVLATTPLQVPAQAPAMPEQEQPMVGQPPQTQFTRDQGMPGERLFMDLMRTMP